MSEQSTVRVVVGEAEPCNGALRFVLDGEGFDVVGEGSTPAELERILPDTQPAVVVLSADISARAVLTVRKRAPSAKIIVVWPTGVSAAIADDRVEPSQIYDELGHAVRRQADRRLVSIPEAAEPIHHLILLPDAETDSPIELEFAAETETTFTPELAASAPVHPGRRSARTLVGVSSLVSLVILMIGVAFALDASKRPTRPVDRTSSHPSPSVVSGSVASPSPVSRSGGRNGERDAATGSTCRQASRSNGRGTLGSDNTPHGNKSERGNHGSACGAQGHAHRVQGAGKGNNAHRHPGGAGRAGAEGSGRSSKPPNESGHASDHAHVRDTAGTRTHGSAASSHPA